MRVFVTGATGFIGSEIVKELVRARHQVIGLTRSDAGAEALQAAGAEVRRGSLEDLDSLRSGAAAADAVIHTAFNHDWSKFAESCAMDKRAIETLGSVLLGSDRHLIVTGGLGVLAKGSLATEDDPPIPVSDSYPRASEATAAALEARGAKCIVMRLPQVHNVERQGLVSLLVATARTKGVSAYIGDGQNRWAAAHVLDVARLYRLALEHGRAGARYHAVAEEGVTLKDIAAAIGRRFNLPVTSISQDAAAAHFGFLGAFAGMNLEGSSARTRAELGWTPTGPGLLTDIGNIPNTQA